MAKAFSNRRRVRILIADDFRQWRVQVCRILQSHAELQVVGEACDGLEAVQKAAELRPDIVLLDIGMPILNGIQAAKQIRQACPESSIMFLTQYSDPEMREAALSIGAYGYILKVNAGRELVSAIGALSLKTQPEVPYRAVFSGSSAE